ncbi:MAG: hypothetical protein VCE75_24215, partial [Alphaproteobacteria bacterium]
MNHGTRQADTLSAAGRLGWLRLIRSEIVGPIAFHQLPNQFGTAGAALDAQPNLARRGGGRRMIRVYTTAAAAVELEAGATVGARPLPSCEVAYPPRLGALPKPPPLIYVLGDPPGWRSPLFPSSVRAMPRPPPFDTLGVWPEILAVPAWGLHPGWPVALIPRPMAVPWRAAPLP